MSKQYKPQYEILKSRWLGHQKSLQRTLTEKHRTAFDWIRNASKHFAVGTLGSLIMLSTPITSSMAARQHEHVVAPKENLAEPLAPQTRLILDLAGVLPSTVDPLTHEQEQKIGQILSRAFGMKVSAELQGKRLNRSYGIIGAEQHLARYPGDTMATHFVSATDVNQYYSSGMAPGLGAWGYFTTGGQLTQKDIDREKYYIAVQTFLAPGWTEHIKEYADFFKYRKMLVVNPENGKAIVADIADSGPSPWTGKHLGGSPEVMAYLQREDGAARGPVLYFFIDDPNDTIALGPVTEKAQ